MTLATSHEWANPKYVQLVQTEQVQITRITDEVAPESIFVVSLYDPRAESLAMLTEWLPSKAVLNDAESDRMGVVHLEFVVDGS